MDRSIIIPLFFTAFSALLLVLLGPRAFALVVAGLPIFSIPILRKVFGNHVTRDAMRIKDWWFGVAMDRWHVLGRGSDAA